METNGSFQTGHIGLNVRDIERSKDFYQKVFDLEIMGESKNDGKLFAFLGTGDKLILTLWQQSDKDFSTSTAGLHHLSFQVESLEVITKTEQILKDLGAKIEYDGIVAHGEGAASGGIFFYDPDGIRLEIYAPKGLEEFEAPRENAPSCGFF